MDDLFSLPADEETQPHPLTNQLPTKEEQQPTEHHFPEPSKEKSPFIHVSLEPSLKASKKPKKSKKRRIRRSKPEPSPKASKKFESSPKPSDFEFSSGSLDFKAFDNNVPATKRETDIQEQDKKKAKNKQSRARNGKDKVKPKPNRTCCSKEGLEDKILVPIPESSQRPIIIEKICFDCGDLVRGLYCRRCALIRKTLEELFLQITSESSDDKTNVVNAPREPFVANQDPDENSSPSPPQIDHCCHKCGDSLDGIFCRRCTCKFCRKGAHYGYNCPPKVPIITNPEPCNTQTISEPLQNLQSLQQQCLLRTCQQCGCNEYDGVCFYCKVGNGTPINVSTPYSSNNSPSVANHPPQSQYVPYSCELCGNDSHYGYDCPPQVPFALQKKEEEKRIAEEQAAKESKIRIYLFAHDDDRR
ncbi:hypothetical protein Tco_0904450 [Tanacetum coccineum]